MTQLEWIPTNRLRWNKCVTDGGTEINLQQKWLSLSTGQARYEWRNVSIVEESEDHTSGQSTPDCRTQRPSVDDCIKKLGGDPERFRQILTDKDEMLARLCHYATLTAKRKRCEPWSIIGQVLGHGSGVSSAIYELYRDRTDDE